MRKLRRAGRDLLYLVGHPSNMRRCMDCRNHPARVEIRRRKNRDGSAYSIKSSTLLHLCETCALRLIGDLVGMLELGTHNRVDAELSMKTLHRNKVDRDCGDAERRDRFVRERLKRLA